MSATDEPPTPDELLSAALSYAAQGLKIYPVFIRGLKPDGKKDVHVPIRSWYDATDDAEQVRAWWGGQYRGAGIGVDMGGSRLAVADGDTHDGGVEKLKAFLGEEVGHPSNTASGGVHVWYRDTHGTVGTGSNILGSKKDPSGVDARGIGGTIFMPPTHVPGYGTYRWTAGEPDWANLPEAPAKLAAACPPGGRKKERTTAPPAPAAAGSPFAVPSTVGLAGAPIVHRDRMITMADAKARLTPLWEEIRDTKSPNGVWQAVASFARAAAHYQCFWDQGAIERMVLAAYAEGGHGYTWLDGDDLRAIASGYQLQREARDSGDLDEGWAAIPSPDSEALAAAVEAAPPDAVEALLAEMVTLEQIKEAPPKRYLIKGYLNLDSESWMIGAPGSRKSFVALDMACHVAGGRPWQGARVTPGKVVIIAAEGAGGLGARVKAWEVEHGPLPAGVIVLPRPVQVADVAAWAVLVKACERIGPVMVVIDTQARVTAGLDENSSQLSVFVDAVTAVRRATGACVLAIHHTSKAGQDARGHSVIDGAQDTELKVVACAEPLTGELRTDKQKDLAELPALKLRFKVHTVGVDDDGEPISSLALAAPGVWDGAEVAAEQPEEWETGHAVAIVQLFKVLRDQGASAGLTKAEARQAIVERFYGGQAARLSKSTYYTAWDRAMAKVSVTGDQVMTNVGGQRWTVDESALKALAAPGDL